MRPSARSNDSSSVRALASGARRGGFTVAEVIVAIVMLSIGFLGAVGTTATLTRMIGRGGRAAHAAFIAQQEFETMRATALGTGGCAAIASGGDTSGIYVRQWTVTTGGTATRVQMTLTYPTSPTRTRVDTLGTTIAC